MGFNNRTISNCYSIGTVVGNVSIGGLVGLNNRSLSDSYSNGSVSGNEAVGGLVGSNLENLFRIPFQMVISLEENLMGDLSVPIMEILRTHITTSIMFQLTGIILLPEVDYIKINMKIGFQIILNWI